jgi:hypothetical protein
MFSPQNHLPSFKQSSSSVQLLNRNIYTQHQMSHRTHEQHLHHKNLQAKVEYECNTKEFEQ